MIEIPKEELIGLAEAARLIPAGATGKRVHISTICRWIKKGTRGVRLEALRVGGRWYTSEAALQRFADRLTEQIQSAPTHHVSTEKSSNEGGEVDRELDALGF